MSNEIPLRYGCNPHQADAKLSVRSGEMPLSVLNGSPGYINLMDALNAWQLVRELRHALNLPAAASFKHVSPAGAAVGTPLSDALAHSYRVDDLGELSPVATAYARARGADRISSFGDFTAVSDTVDLSLAAILKREVSDGIIAPGYDSDALELLKEKKGGNYLVLQIDQNYEAPPSEAREIFGMTFEQTSNHTRLDRSILDSVASDERLTGLPEWAVRDLLVATITLKYTQSNSIAVAYDGQCIGIGAGQQSRIHCVRLACHKADLWFLRQHSKLLSLPFKKGVKRPDTDNTTDQFLSLDATPTEIESWAHVLETVPDRLSQQEKTQWLARVEGVSLSSDAFIPFRDTVDRAHESGVGYIVETGGSIRAESVIEACNEYRIRLHHSGVRLFHH